MGGDAEDASEASFRLGVRSIRASFFCLQLREKVSQVTHFLATFLFTVEMTIRGSLAF